jgi:hypothetical protein
MRDGRKLKAVVPGGSSMPVLPAETMLATDMDYDSIAKGRLDAGLGSGHRHGRNDLHGARAAAALPIFTSRNLAASVRRAAKAPAGSTAWFTASSTARGVRKIWTS